jgi:importin subunit alpha-1
MKYKQSMYLVLEACWCLTNVVAGSTTQCQSVIEKGGIPEFIKLLREPDPDIVDQAIWSLGNIAGDCSHYRDIILRAGAID